MPPIGGAPDPCIYMIYIYTEAGTVGDNEVEAIAAAKWSRTDEIYMHISIERRLYINILT